MQNPDRILPISDQDTHEKDHSTTKPFCFLAICVWFIPIEYLITPCV